MSGEPKTLTPEQEKAAREAFETRYKGFTWWTEKYGELHPALHKDEDGNYLEGSQRKYWTGFQEGYAAALGVPVVARDEAAELRAAAKEWAEAKQAVDDADRAWTDAIDARQGVSGRQAAWTRAMERERTAELALRRLAGGESEQREEAASRLTEANELKAAAIEWWQAMRDYRYVVAPDLAAQEQRLRAAENALAGVVRDLLAGGESEK